MARKLIAEPFKNITNRQSNKKQSALTETEQEVLRVHTSTEKDEICAMSKYSKQIMQYYESLDNIFTYQENDITYEMRSLLADWLISCHEKLKLCDDSLFLSIFLIDRFLSGRSLSSSKLQLVGITALVVASKYEEVLCPDLSSFMMLSDKSFSEAEIKKAEKYMLYSLNYTIEYVNPLFFLRRVSKANNYEAKSRKMAKYFLELMILERAFVMYKKNILGTTAMYLARKICQTDFNKNLFFYYAKIERSEMKECFDALIKLIYSPPKYENVESKYGKESMFHVNTLARGYAKANFN